MRTRFHTTDWRSLAAGGLMGATLLVGGCATSAQTSGGSAAVEPNGGSPATTGGAARRAEAEKFEADRQAILAMAGDYAVTFDFRETVAFADGYELKEPKLSGGHEVVRVIADEGDFISLQHILVVGGGDNKAPVKHWRQDWRYEPAQVLKFVGGNAWRMEAVSAGEREGAWSQVVYQVDDAPRYGAVGEWSHEAGLSEWTPPAEWRPLPRRDATTRDDYDAVDAVNRHAITPFGWVHEQDNSKLVLRDGQPQVIVREVGVNTYRKIESDDAHIADDYWAATKDYWAGVRTEWTRLENEVGEFALTVQGEPEPVYQPLLKLAKAVEDGETTKAVAVAEAIDVIATFTTQDIGALRTRLAQAPVQAGAGE